MGCGCGGGGGQSRIAFAPIRNLTTPRPKPTGIVSNVGIKGIVALPAPPLDDVAAQRRLKE